MVQKIESYKTSRGQLESDLIRAVAWEMTYCLEDSDESFNLSRALTVLKHRTQVLAFFHEMLSEEAASKNKPELEQAARHIRTAVDLIRSVGE